MGSLGGCLKRLGFSAEEGTHIRRLVKAYRDDGISGPEANLKAVADLIRDTEAQRADILRQINTAPAPTLTETDEQLRDAAIDRAMARAHGLDVPELARTNVRLTIRKALAGLDHGTLSSDAFAGKISTLYETLQARHEEKQLEGKPRVRGAAYLRERVNQAVRRGDIPQAQADLAEWFLKGNEHLFTDLGISVRTPEGGSAGSYNPLGRIMTLMKGTKKTDTAVHEMLHHLERLMPAEYQDAIRKEWAAQIAERYRQAEAAPGTRGEFMVTGDFGVYGVTTAEDLAHSDPPLREFGTAEEAQAWIDEQPMGPAIKSYLDAVLLANATNSKEDWDAAHQFIQRGAVPYDLYSLMNSSEFWAVNGSAILEARHTGIWGKIAQWMREAIQRIRGALQLTSQAPILEGLHWLQTTSEGNKLSKSMLSEATTYSDITSDIREPDYTVSAPSRFDAVIRTLQDKNIDTKRVVQAIEATGKSLADEANPVLQEEMYQSRVMSAQKETLIDELSPLLKTMELNSVTVARVDKYAHALHAHEANAALKAINPDLADNDALSGMTDADAEEILANEDRPKMDQIMRHLQAILAKTRQQMVAYGLETQKTVDKWTATYDFYVPLHREGFDEQMGTGLGKNIRGSSVKTRLGSHREVSNILAHIIQDRDKVIVRGEKNRVTTAMAGLLMTNPNRQIATLAKPAPIEATNPETGLLEVIPGDIGDYKVPRIRYLNKETGAVEFRPDRNYKGRDNVLNFRVKGKDYAIIFNEHDPTAVQIAKAMKDTDIGQLNAVIATVAPVTRYIAQVNTQFSPIFGIVNFIRDVQFAMLSLSSTPLAGKRGEVLANTRKSMFGIYQDARAIRRGEHPHSATAELWERFQHVGGPTGYRDLFRTSADRAKQIEHLLDPHWWQKTTAGKILTIGGVLNAPVAFAEEQIRQPLFNWLSDYNQTMENAVRLGVFQTAIDMGFSDIQAASLAKNITVNFNKKGQISTQMGALYAFFNASVQGTARMAETLFVPGKIGVLSRSGKNILAGGLLLGAMQAVLLAMAGFDDDEPKEFVKQSNLIIPIPGTDKGFVMIPMPLGFNFIPTVGRLVTEAIIGASHGKGPGKQLVAALSAGMNIFSPVGTATPLQTVSPSFIDPVVALTENKDWTGRTIAREDVSSLNPTPGFTRTKDSATPWARGLAEAINYATWGTKYTPGLLSPTPDQIDYLVAQATGGVGREISKGASVLKAAQTGEAVPLYKTPLLGRFAGEASGDAAVRDKFFTNLRELNIAEEELKGRAKNHEDVQGYLREHPEARLFPMGDAMQRAVAQLQKHKHDLVKQGAPKERIQLLEMQITSLERRLNERMAAAR